MRGFVVDRRIARTRIQVHWSVLIALPFAYAVGNNLLFGAIGFVSFLLLLIAHELGHAVAARSFKLHVSGIAIFPFHGQCHFEAPHYGLDHYLIAWAGVAAQALLLMVFTAVHMWGAHLPVAVQPFLTPFIFVFVWLNILIMMVNLLPLPGLDGYYAWRIVPAVFNGQLVRLIRTRQRR